MAQLSLNSCESLVIRGVLKQVIRKKDGRVAKLRLQNEDGICEIKASKYLRVERGYTPAQNDVVALKVLRKVKSGRIKQKAFEIIPNDSTPLSSSKPLKPAIACKPAEILLCQSSKCRKQGAQKLLKQLKKELAHSGSHSEIRLASSKCLGKCKKGPAAKFIPSGKVYCRLDMPTVLHLLP